MRAREHTWDEIAAALGFRSRGAARTAVKRYLDRTAPETPEEARRFLLEDARYDARVLREGQEAAATRGDDETVLAYTKARTANRDQRAKLSGAFAPTNVNVSVDTAPSAVGAEWLRQVAARAAAVSGGQPAALASAAEVIDAEVIP
ncbi:hypothetical protein [Mycobacterium sp. HNNTM2301]|uniref:hypothetical protein n=1 Tax=Mycobacterium hainanense TaxID=3289775 RepID=UPI0035A66676